MKFLWELITTRPTELSGERRQLVDFSLEFSALLFSAYSLILEIVEDDPVIPKFQEVSVGQSFPPPPPPPFTKLTHPNPATNSTPFLPPSFAGNVENYSGAS